MRKIGQYQLITEIARGGMGEIYIAQDTRLSREVAVKLLMASLANDTKFAQRFIREGQLVAPLEHPNIVPLYDYGVDPEFNQPYLVMRLMRGGTLEDRLDEMNEEEIWRTIRQIGTALDYAHNNNVVHRDLKPSNILFDREGNAYLTDFGIALQAQSTETRLTQGGIIGTPHYMSPEQFRSGMTMDGKSDQYSFAVMIYELLAKHPLFEGDTMALLFQHLNEEPYIDVLRERGFPEHVIAALLKALSKEPEDRFESVGDFVKALQGQIAVPKSVNRATEEAETDQTEVLEIGATEVLEMEPTELLEMGATEVLEVGAVVEPQPSNRTRVWIYSIGGIIGVVGLALVAFNWLQSNNILPGSVGVIEEIPPTVTQTLESEAENTPSPMAIALEEGTETADVLTVEANSQLEGVDDTATPSFDETETALPPTETPLPTITPTPLPTFTPTPVDITTQDMNGHEWIEIPASQFLMGSSDTDAAAEIHEKPQHEVNLESFWVAKLETTNSQYKTFIDDGNEEHIPAIDDNNCTVWQSDGSFDLDFSDHPVVCISWYNANAYAEWLSINSDFEVRLPTEAEWEKAARGEDGRIYPWGNEFNGELLNYCDTNCEFEPRADDNFDDGFVRTSPVGSFPQGGSPYKVEDMGGNVWEWTGSLWGSENEAEFLYPYDRFDGREDLAAGPEVFRVSRGGSWGNGFPSLRAAKRNKFKPDVRNYIIGFRVVAKSPISTLTNDSLIAPTETPLPTPTVEVQCEQGATLSQIYTYDDPANNFLAPVGLSLRITFELLNSGTCEWDSSFVLSHISGSDFGSEEGTLLGQSVAPGESITVVVRDLQTPNAIGQYPSAWGLLTDEGDLIESRFEFELGVYSRETATPVPTATTEQAISTPTAEAGEPVDGQPVNFNHSISNCTYPGDGIEYRCDLVITPYGGVSGDTYTVWVNDSEPMARYYPVTTTFTHFINARRCATYVHEVIVQSDATGERLSRNIFFDPNSNAVFPGGTTCVEP